ncbi:MAG: hypothetical protein ACOX7N_03050 [Lawsonibacter sp.]|jgi:hypothetical protein
MKKKLNMTIGKLIVLTAGIICLFSVMAMATGSKGVANETEKTTSTVHLKDVEGLKKNMVQADETIENVPETGEKSESDGEEVAPESEKVSETQAVQEDVSTEEENTNELNKFTPKTVDEAKTELEEAVDSAPQSGYTIVVFPEAVEEQREETRVEGLIERAYPQNAAGLTYGTMAQRRITGEYPDLISVVATNGESGYVKLEDFDPIYALVKNGASNEEINAEISRRVDKQEENGESTKRTISVYDLDMNIIGEFVIENFVP